MKLTIMLCGIEPSLIFEISRGRQFFLSTCFYAIGGIYFVGIIAVDWIIPPANGQDGY
jgi:hypothetical protein